MPARSFGPFTSDGIPVPAGAKVQLRVTQTSGVTQNLAKLRFGVAQLEPKGSGGLLLPAIGAGGIVGGPQFVTGSWIAIAQDAGSSTQNLSVIVGDPPETVTPEDNVTLLTGVAWSPDGAWLGLASNANGFCLMEVATGDLVANPFSTGSNVESVAFSPDGSMLACGISSALFLVDMADQTHDDTWPSVPAFNMSWSPGGERLATIRSSGSGSTTPQLYVIDVGTKTEESGWPALNSGARAYSSLAWSPDGEYLAVGGWNTPFWNLIRTSDRTPITVPALAGRGRAFAWSPDGQKLAIGCEQSPFLAIMDMSDPEDPVLEANPTIAAFVLSLSWHWQGEYLAVGFGSGDRLTVLDTSDWTVLGGWPSFSNNVTAVAFAYDPVNVTSG